VPKAEYKALLAQAVEVEAQFPVMPEPDALAAEIAALRSDHPQSLRSDHPQ
jgi:hypothetical protein